MIQKIYKILSSARLALALLVVILTCCVVGVTVFRGARAGSLIFATLWFNGLLVLLVINVACCFFPRMWGRKLTVVSFGMILFHLSFVAILLGIAYNSLFSFHGVIRLTEGEILPLGEEMSWDTIDKGQYFDTSLLEGEITLKRMHRGYVVEGEDKLVAYEVAIRKGRNTKEGILYITKKLSYNGFSYFREKEGYTTLVILYDRSGKELHGAYYPLQSFLQSDDTYLYSTGTKEGPAMAPFPMGQVDPVFDMQLVYIPDKEKERDGEVVFRGIPFQAAAMQNERFDHPEGSSSESAGGKVSVTVNIDDNDHDVRKSEKTEEKLLFDEKVRVGERAKAGDYYLSVPEIRYWVAMSVRYDPGFPLILTSFWVGLGGMIMTFFGRMWRSRKRS